ncbi:MAG: hypothetical protein IPP81_19005 [Chitinophagaceae bacterium]|nr:hypothetical protein [Chitinophagaceae bacterium]
MHHFTLIFVSFVLNIFSSDAQGIYEMTWSTIGIKGKVKEITQRSYGVQFKFGELEKNQSEISDGYAHYIFNEKGFATEYGLGNKQIIEYNELGNKISQTMFANREDKSEYLYKKIIWKYDNNGKIVEQNEYDKDGNLTRKDLYKYDKNGKLSQFIDYDKDGNFSRKFLYKYDKNGNPVENSAYDENDTLVSKTLYKYDSDKKLIEYTSYRKFGNSKWGSIENSKSIYKYDKSGNLLQNTTQVNTQDVISKKTTSKMKLETYKYNDKSEMIEYTSGIPNDTKSTKTIKYEYDSYSNWIKAIVLNNTSSDFKNSIKEREIIYY